MMAKEIDISTWKLWRKHKCLMVMAIPTVVFFIVFHYVPMYGIIIAFKDFRIGEGILGGQWNGLDHFRYLFSGATFLNAVRNTVTISLLRLTFGFFAPILLALLLNEVRIAWYKRGIQTLTYLPYFFSWVVLGGIFRMLLATDGPVNSSAALLGADPVEFLTNKYWFVAVIIVTGIWQTAGYSAVIYLAALAGIPAQLYEAATVDGAGRWKQTLHITLPSLVPTIVTLFILSLGGVLNAGFDQIYNMYNPAVYDTSDILGTYMLRRLQNLDFALGAAAGLFKSIISMVLIVIVNTIAKRISHGEQGIW